MHLVIKKGFTFRDKNKVKWVLKYRDGGSKILMITPNKHSTSLTQQLGKN